MEANETKVSTTYSSCKGCTVHSSKCSSCAVSVVSLYLVPSVGLVLSVAIQ